MRLAQEVITVFNQSLDEDTGYDIWTPTWIRGASWYSNVTSAVTNDGLIAADQYTIRIPTGVTTQNDRPYAKQGEYIPGQNWTLKHGDIIIKGKETSTDLNPKQLREKYGEIVTIVSVTDNRRAPRAKHWRVVGK